MFCSRNEAPTGGGGGLKFLEKSLLGGVRNCWFFLEGGEGNFVEWRRGGGGGGVHVILK